MKYDPKEYNAFREMIVRHFASLVDVSSRYTAKLLLTDREWFFDQALEKAWERRRGFNPSRQRLTKWWNEICKEVAKSRPEWTVLTLTGEKIVKGKHLHLWGQGNNGDPLDTI